MKNATMLYRSPGPEVYEGVPCETIVVDEPEVQAHLADGWSRNWIEAGEVVKDAAAKLAANEQKQTEIEAKLAAAGKVDGKVAALQAVHKGRGKYDVVDADGAVVATGLTKEEAQAKAGG